MGTPFMLSCLVQGDSASMFGFGEKKKDEQVATLHSTLSPACTRQV